MIILHAGRVGKQFFLWGESPAENETPPVRRGRKPKKPVAKPYPYDSGVENLSSALELLLGSTGRKKAEEINVWVPTAGWNPIPSSPLVAETPASKAEPAFAPWTVHAYPLEAEEAVVLLCACMGKKVLAPGIISGNDLLWWADALKFAGSLVAGQKYLPGVRGGEGEYRAFWEPVFSGEDAGELAKLAKQMPPAAKALAPEASSVPPEMPAAVVARQFIEESLDWIVRSEIGEKELAKGTRKRKSFDSVHDAWVSALKSSDGLIYGEENELLQLAVRAREWQRPLTVLTTSPFRFCFRLEEPAMEEGTEETEETEAGKIDTEKGGKGIADIEVPEELWYVRYMLQSYEDPSLLIPVKEAWKPKKGSPLKRYDVKNIRQFLLSSLGQAAGISAGIASSLESPNPSGYSLDTKEAYRFLTESAANLSQAGFGLLLPGWWTRKGTKTSLKAQAKVKGKKKLQAGYGLTLDKIVSFDWEIALGDRALTIRELQSLAKLKAPLVKFRGQWVEVNDAEIRAALEFWKKTPNGEASLREVLKLAVGVSEKTDGVDVEGLNATGWIEELIRRLKDKTGFEELPAPDGFSGALRPYQFRGYSWLAFLRQWGIGACLADDMGLGKTVQTLALIQHDLEQVKDQVDQVEEKVEEIAKEIAEEKVDGLKAAKPVLLVCPTSVINNWKKEAARFTPGLSVMVHHGTSRKKEEEFKKEAINHAIVISSYGLLQRDLKFLKGVSWAGVILDEAQNIKNPETKQAKAARALEADYRIALTGTPVENNVGDLWSIMEFLNPGFLGSQAGFKRNFFIPIQAERDQEAASRLKEITGPFILRRLKTDTSIISDLPEKMEMKTYCTLTKEQASLYAAVLEDIEEAMEEAEEGIRRKGIILSALTRLKQVCNHPAQFLKDNSTVSGRSGKLARLTEMLDVVLENGEKALVFTQFAEMGKMLKEHLQASFGCEVLFLHGGVPRKQRDRMLERFQEGKEYLPIFVLSLKAGGTGLNLTGANHVFHFDRWWNPAVENQATDRAFRIGQTKNVEVHKFICAGTLEERIDEIIERKVQVAENVVGTGEGWLTELSNEELKDILALREEAVGE
ncbi:Helicase, SNF2/RAD54 family [Methanosarcina siciliae T4/M]|uniref:Helicase, SNF2/RAD54 family n=1 Tax=Methanosarcina siciliae T4/M TaxID=1434120 RepID=A0A0E3L7J4_9EURY|nr:DEAD/DEAH box helicase [Methanosarcina siciliae]AKB26876.1 Helicase, SNF2/RAD54 family [Methanosarcina siciliae T4/M]